MRRITAADRPLLAVTVALIGYGVLILYSAGQTDIPTPAAHVWQRQLAWIAIGAVAGLLVARTSPRVLEWVAPAVYGVALVLLLVTLAVGTGGGTAASTRSWLAIGGVRIGQPAEFAKLATVLMLARFLAGQRGPAASLRELAVPVLIAAAPAALVAGQPDLGSALVFAGIMFAMLFWAGTPPRFLVLLASPILSLVLAFSPWSWGAWIFLLCALLIVWRPFVWEGLGVLGANLVTGVIALPLWQRLAEYQQNRLISFLNPDADPRATGWHIIQSKIAIGSGGFLGKGFTEGTQKRLGYLPEQHTDFIFPVVGEELGFVGIAVALGLFLFLLVTLIRIARRASEPFASLATFGIVGILFTHIFENVGMTANVMPITGIPLPFFSYGGSFLVSCLMAIGFCLRVAYEGKEMGYREM